MRKYRIKIDNHTFNVSIKEEDNRLKVDVDGKIYDVNLAEIEDLKIKKIESIRKEEIKPEIYAAPPAETSLGNDDKKEALKTITAPMNGLIISVNVKQGDMVRPDTLVCIMESMKMESEIFSGKQGQVKSISVKSGEVVRTGQTIIELE